MSMFFIMDNDRPIYEYSSIQTKEQLKTLMSVHASLDTIDYLLQSQKRQCYLGVVSSDQPIIVGYSNISNLRFLLVLQMTRKDYNREVQQKVKGFFSRVNECLITTIMNPLYSIHGEITSLNFDAKIRDAMTKKLGILAERRL